MEPGPSAVYISLTRNRIPISFTTKPAPGRGFEVMKECRASDAGSAPACRALLPGPFPHQRRRGAIVAFLLRGLGLQPDQLIVFVQRHGTGVPPRERPTLLQSAPAA